MSSQQTGGLKPTRRTLVKGAAWSVPVVAMGAQAAAADVTCSPNSCPTVVTFSGNACKLPGNSQDIYKGYRFELVATNQSTTDVVVTINSVTVANVTEPSYEVYAACGDASCTCSQCNGICVPAGTTIRLHVDTANPSGNSQNTEFAITYSVSECGPECTVVVANVPRSSGPNSTPPVQGGKCNLCA